MDHISNRRYLTRFDTSRMGQIFCDVLVIGSGCAGLRAALESAGAGADTLIITKGEAKQSNTHWAQGGIAAALAPDDSTEAHLLDTLNVGCGLCDEPAVRELVEDGPRRVLELAAWGCPFDKEEGRGERGEEPKSEISNLKSEIPSPSHLLLGREGGHSANRIVHALGDNTGKAIAQTLLARVRSAQRIRLFERCFAIDLVTGRDGSCLGAVTFHPKYGHQMIWAKQTLLASGGCGVVFRETTNPDIATGDGHALAYRAGAVLRDMEFMQFHPTTLYVAGASRVLISEAVRGEGGWLVHRDGKRFMSQYHPMAELAPRDVVSRAIMAELAKTGATCVYVDVRHFPPGSFSERFPRITELCAKFDINPEKQLIPIRPSAHYMIGGLRCNLAGQTSVPGLLVAGEAASTGVHGANRLASNSLLEGLVYGAMAGAEAARLAAEQDNHGVQKIKSDVPDSDRTELDVADVKSSLRSVMWRNVGIERSEARLQETIEIIDFWSRYTFDKVFDSPAEWELQNMLCVARLMTAGALERRESRGTHWRSDYPALNDEQWGHHIELRRGMG